MMLTPAQMVSAVGSNSPLNLGFLAYTWYQQYLWYMAAKHRNHHALSLFVYHLDFVCCFTAIGGVPSGNLPMGILFGFGTAGLFIMNTFTAWISWKTNLPEGDGVYQFFFFGWRTLSPRWRHFFLSWVIADSILAAIFSIAAIGLGILIPLKFDKDAVKDYERRWGDGSAWWDQKWFYSWVTWVHLITVSLMAFVELTVKRNKIVSDTDMVSVYLFIAQVVLLVVGIVWKWVRK
ncbi:hypothetical protein NMY22_g10658 [Coprinellus aureogranulatus]|nr:hypothetical protein NMY22_g10658 [Coprinellus aureogranulatus]